MPPSPLDRFRVELRDYRRGLDIPTSQAFDDMLARAEPHLQRVCGLGGDCEIEDLFVGILVSQERELAAMRREVGRRADADGHKATVEYVFPGEARFGAGTAPGHTVAGQSGPGRHTLDSFFT